MKLKQSSCMMLIAVLICLVVSADARISWTCATENAGFEARYGFGFTIHNDKMWVINGAKSIDAIYSDVWNSEDGANWVNVTNSSNNPMKFIFTLVSFKDKMWIIGGHEGGC